MPSCSEEPHLSSSQNFHLFPPHPSLPPNSPALSSPLSPIILALTSNRTFLPKTASLSPLPATLTHPPSPNSFTYRSYANHRGVGLLLRLTNPRSSSVSGTSVLTTHFFLPTMKRFRSLPHYLAIGPLEPRVALLRGVQSPSPRTLGRVLAHPDYARTRPSLLHRRNLIGDHAWQRR